MTMHSLYLAHPNGFDNVGRWYDHHKAMHAKHPLDCAEFGAEWLQRWEAVGRLLAEPIACVEAFCPPRSEWYAADFDPCLTVGGAILAIAPIIHKKPRTVRIKLLDGTIIREWPAKDDYDDIF